MKKSPFYFALPLALSLHLIAHADEAPFKSPSETPVEQDRFLRNSFGIEEFWMHNSTRVKNMDNRLAREYWHVTTAENNSYYTGLRWTLERLNPNSYYFGSDMIFAVGTKLHQNFHGLHKSNHAIRDSAELWGNAEIAAGYNFQPSHSPHSRLSVFAGPGYHFERKTIHPFFYHKDHRTADWYYAMAGMKISQDFSSAFTVGMDAKTMYSFLVRDKAFITGLSRWGQKMFWGLELGLPMTWHVGSSHKLDVRFNPYLLKFNLDSYETILGARLEVGYSF